MTESDRVDIEITYYESISLLRCLINLKEIEKYINILNDDIAEIGFLVTQNSTSRLLPIKQL